MCLVHQHGLHVIEDDAIKLHKFPEQGRVQYSFYGGVASTDDTLVSYGEMWEEIIGVSALSGNG